MEQDAECEAVPPQQREQLRLVERQTKLYHVTLRQATVWGIVVFCWVGWIGTWSVVLCWVGWRLGG